MRPDHDEAGAGHMSGVTQTRGIARRLALSLLAGSGMGAVGLGGPLVGGALASDPSPGSTPSDTTTSTSEAPTQTTPPSTTSSTPTTPTPSPETTTSSTSTTPAPATPAGSTTTGPTTTAPAGGQTTSTATTTTQAPRPRLRAPKVAVQRAQEPTVQTSASTPSTTTGAATPAPAANIAAAPQLAAAQSNALTALLAGSSASARALDFYRIPLFLLPIYQAASVQYGVPWQVLAAINEVETNFGTDLAVSSAGAVGWMQFMPETWLQYGVDAVNAGYADPYNPVDAIFAAARYLHAAGASTDLRAAILAYNHSEAYAESVLLRARLFSSYPPSVIATLTGLTEGSLPTAGAQLSSRSIIPTGVLAPSPEGASDAAVGAAATSSTTSPTTAHSATAALPGSTPAPSPAASLARAKRALEAPSPPSQLSELIGRENAPVIAVEDGRIVRIGSSRKIGKYIVLRDTYGDLFTYAGLGSVARDYRQAKPTQIEVPTGALRSGEPGSDPAPKQAATAGTHAPLTLHVADRRSSRPGHRRSAAASDASSAGSAPGKVRVFAHPGNPDAIAAARLRARTSRLRHNTDGWTRLSRGSVVAQGTVLGHLGANGESSQASLHFSIRPAGAQSAVDPRPILENWRQLDVALHPQGAKLGLVLAGATASDAFLLTRPELERAVLSDPGILLGACDRGQVAAGKVSRQTLALLVFLSRSGLKPTVGELRCGRVVSTPGGPVTVFPAAGTLDIASINGVPIAGHQGAGTITDITIRTLLTLQHKFAPKRIVSLMKYPDAPATTAQADHSDYIQIELPQHTARAVVSRTAHPAESAAHGHATAPANVVLNSLEWQRLMTQASSLQTPHVPRKPSSSAIRDK